MEVLLFDVLEQSEGVISMLKHYSPNNIKTNRIGWTLVDERNGAKCAAKSASHGGGSFCYSN